MVSEETELTSLFDISILQVLQHQTLKVSGNGEIQGPVKGGSKSIIEFSVLIQRAGPCRRLSSGPSGPPGQLAAAASSSSFGTNSGPIFLAAQEPTRYTRACCPIATPKSRAAYIRTNMHGPLLRL